MPRITTRVVWSLCVAIATVSLCGCGSLLQQPISEHPVYSPALHITVTKPEAWEFVAQREVRDAQRHASSANRLVNYLAYQNGVVPLVAIQRNKRITSDRPPAFMIHREPLGEDRFASNEKIARQVLGVYRYVFDQTQIVGPIVTVKIGGEEYANARLRHVTKMRDGSVFNVHRDFWVRRSGLSAVIISACYDELDGAVAILEVEQIVRSISPAPTANRS